MKWADPRFATLLISQGCTQAVAPHECSYSELLPGMWSAASKKQQSQKDYELPMFKDYTTVTASSPSSLTPAPGTL